MFEAVGEGRIKAIWIMATNPAVSLPHTARVREALAACPFVVVSDCMEQTDTMALAHVKLPALAWGEKDGTVTNSERRISRQRPLFDPPGEARADWRIIADVARAMGFGDGFGWSSPASVFREWARLTAYENQDRTLDLGPLAGLSPWAYEILAPVQWPVSDAGGTVRLFTDGRFPTPDGRARMVPVRLQGPARATSPAFPFALNSGRVRDHWHTMTRTGLAADLCRHAPEPYVDIHPRDAKALGIVESQLTRIQTAHGEAVVTARVTDRQRPGEIFMPMHWTDAFAPSGRVNGLMAANIDVRSGQPEFKHTPARVSAYRETWRGFLMTRSMIVAPDADVIWRRVPQKACQLYEFAGRGDGRERLRRALIAGSPGRVIRYEDPSAGVVREAWLLDERLDAVLFTTLAGALPPREWLVALFETKRLTAQQRSALLVGRAPGASRPLAPLVCTCLSVRIDAIRTAISQGARREDEIAEVTGAGSNCGSCRPEIRRLLAANLEAVVDHAA